METLTRTHLSTFQLTGMTCTNCEQKIEALLSQIPDVASVKANHLENQVVMETERPVSLTVFEQALAKYPKYQLAEIKPQTTITENIDFETKTSFWQTYKPLLLIFAFIVGVSAITSFHENSFHWMTFMRTFMAGFFLVFSFFKLLNIKDFANSYAMYDWLAMKVPAYGKLYPFIELALGIAFLTAFNPLFTNIATIIVMGFSSLGVVQSLLDKKKIRCACLGAVFNLPMSTITLTEDLLMVAMAAGMLLM
ncbi:MAG: heavy metal translocating P-type ATPase [Verrucomicrobia bacterium]|nr:heavy metal translocating P-type ATPase [Cytophagales bacterium]